MKREGNIFLVGPMGAGKSTIGKYLAQLLKMEFYDVDQEVEKQSGADIAWIFDIEGEAGFRKREAGIIEALTQKNNIVLATGGGAILDQNNCANLSHRGMVIYLYATIAQQGKRTLKDKKRPLLGTEKEKRMQILEKLMHERDGLYRAIADRVILTQDTSVWVVAQTIVKALEDA